MPENLVARCDSRNPSCISAAFRNITVLLRRARQRSREYFNKAYGYKFIHVNKNLSEREQTIVAAHELGHAVLHPDHCTPFMRANTYYSINKLEMEANEFAVKILISDEEIIENLDYTTEQMAAIFGLPPVLTELRMRLFKPPENLKERIGNIT